MKPEIIPKPEQYDSYDVRWSTDEGELVGYGFVGEGDKEQKIRLIRCPECKRENYAMAVMSGQCAWCGFDANNLTPPHEEQKDN